MPIWFLVMINLLVDLTLVVALVTGRLSNRPWPGLGPKWVDRRENPYFYWFFMAVLTVICVIMAMRLAEAALPGFKAPAFLG